MLPGDDWECTLGDTAPSKPDENNIYGINLLKNHLNQQNLEEYNKQKVHLVEESKVSDNSEEGDYIEVNNVVAVKNNISASFASDKQNIEDSFESSGDGDPNETVELKDGGLEVSEKSKVDPKLAAHLQRLSQLIDGLKQKYQNKPDEAADLRPDQLNAFLAHYNIRSQFDALNPSLFDKRPVPHDGRIEPDVLHQILRKQQQLQAHPPNISIALPSLSNKYVQVQNIQPPQQYNNKILLHNSVPEKQYRKPDGYSTSQIVVNKPEGSVVFSIPPNDKYQPRPRPQEDDEPRISEETLKTVLELSKQMLANQNIRQVFPNNGVFSQMLQPMYVPVPLINPHPNNAYPNKYLPQTAYDNQDKYQKISSSTYSKPEHKRKPPVSIIQNNVPVTIATGSESGMIPRPIFSGSSVGSNNEDTNSFYQSQSNDRVDSYGNKVYNDYENEHNSERDPPHSYQVGNSINSQNSIYSTTLHPPLNYDLATPPAQNTGNSHFGTSNANHMYDTQPPQPPPALPLPYPSDLNIIQEMPKPMLQQSIMQLLSQRPLYTRPSVANTPRPPALQPSDQSPYNTFNSMPSPPQLRPINPASVNIRPNSIQSSGSGASMTGPNSDNNVLPDSPESHFSYNQNSVNNQIVSDLLASNLDQSNADDKTHLVNLGGNFISYDVYKNQILPALGASGAAPVDHKVEIITCATGVRQPNTTDCSKYFVCSKKDGKVLSYSCPPYTGFNAQTHICDAKTYAFCNPQALYSRFTVSENRKIQMDALQALEEAKKVRDEAIQAQNLANLIRLETQKIIDNTTIPQHQGLQNPVILSNYLGSLPQQPPSLENSLAAMALTQTTPKSPTLTSVNTVTTQKRRRFRCSDGGKVPDPQSVLKYYVCFKASDGKMKRRKMECSAGLMFCAKTLLCTLPRKCNAQ